VLLDSKGMKPGDKAGLCAFQSNYYTIGVEVDADGVRHLKACKGAPRRGEQTVLDMPLEKDKVWLKIRYVFTPSEDDTCGADKAFVSYSLDGKTWIELEDMLAMRYTLDFFTGYRSALYSYATSESGGYADFDYFKQEIY